MVYKKLEEVEGEAFRREEELSQRISVLLEEKHEEMVDAKLEKLPQSYLVGSKKQSKYPLDEMDHVRMPLAPDTNR